MQISLSLQTIPKRERELCSHPGYTRETLAATGRGDQTLPDTPGECNNNPPLLSLTYERAFSRQTSTVTNHLLLRTIHNEIISNIRLIGLLLLSPMTLSPTLKKREILIEEQMGFPEATARTRIVRMNLVARRLERVARSELKIYSVPKCLNGVKTQA